jgi:hypothetical protein
MTAARMTSQRKRSTPRVKRAARRSIISNEFGIVLYLLLLIGQKLSVKDD